MNETQSHTPLFLGGIVLIKHKRKTTMHYSTTAEIVNKLHVACETYPDLKDLLKLAADRLVWQDNRYRSLSNLMWGSSTSKSIFTPRSTHFFKENNSE